MVASPPGPRPRAGLSARPTDRDREPYCGGPREALRLRADAHRPGHRRGGDPEQDGPLPRPASFQADGAREDVDEGEGRQLSSPATPTQGQGHGRPLGAAGRPDAECRRACEAGGGGAVAELDDPAGAVGRQIELVIPATERGVVRRRLGQRLHQAGVARLEEQRQPDARAPGHRDVVAGDRQRDLHHRVEQVDVREPGEGQPRAHVGPRSGAPGEWTQRLHGRPVDREQERRSIPIRRATQLGETGEQPRVRPGQEAEGVEHDDQQAREQGSSRPASSSGLVVLVRQPGISDRAAVLAPRSVSCAGRSVRRGDGGDRRTAPAGGRTPPGADPRPRRRRRRSGGSRRR